MEKTPGAAAVFPIFFRRIPEKNMESLWSRPWNNKNPFQCWLGAEGTGNVHPWLQVQVQRIPILTEFHGWNGFHFQWTPICWLSIQREFQDLGGETHLIPSPAVGRDVGNKSFIPSLFPWKWDQLWNGGDWDKKKRGIKQRATSRGKFRGFLEYPDPTAANPHPRCWAPASF